MSFKPTRRDFISAGVGAGLSLPLASRLSPQWLQAAGIGEKILVVLQLRGGSDALHTLAPIEDPVYIKARGNMGIPKAKGLRLTPTSSLYWHPACKGLADLFTRGDLAVIQGIGYPSPNLSHFRSEDIWASADHKATNVKKGWLGTWRNTQYKAGFSIPMMDIESRRNDSFVGSSVPVFTSRAAFQFLVDTTTADTRLDQNLEKALLLQNAKVLRPSADPELKFIADAMVQTATDMSLIQTTGKNYKAAVSYPSANAQERRLSQRMQLIASYIIGGLKTQVYYTDTGGFDTHANQVLANDPVGGAMASLNQRYASVVKAFLDDIKAQGLGKQVVVLLWSEFGRRLGPNGNNGTDHGQAGLAYVAGEPVTGGLYGTYPSLAPYANRTDYHRISLPFTTDFRSMYATLIDKWIGGTHTAVLPGSPYALLGFL